MKTSKAPEKFTGKKAGSKMDKRKQTNTAAPKSIKGAADDSGKKKSVGHNMGGLFGVTPKRSEPENAKPQTQAKMKSDREARMNRLKGLRI